MRLSQNFLQVVEDEQRPRRPPTSVVLENRRLTMRDLVDTVGILEGSVNIILKYMFFLRRAKSYLVPKKLNFFLKLRVDIYGRRE